MHYEFINIHKKSAPVLKTKISKKIQDFMIIIHIAKVKMAGRL